MYQHSDMDWDYMDLKALLEHTRHRYTSVITQRAQSITILFSFLCCFVNLRQVEVITSKVLRSSP
jgi:hypothetical protein